MISVNEFSSIGGEITAAYAVESLDLRWVKKVAKDGNAAMVSTPDGVMVISRPMIEGNILALFDNRVMVLSTDLRWAF